MLPVFPHTTSVDTAERRPIPQPPISSHSEPNPYIHGMSSHHSRANSPPDPFRHRHASVAVSQEDRYTRSDKSYSDRFHKLSRSVTTVRLRLSPAHGYIVGCKEQRTSAAHRKRRSCSVLFTGHPFDEHGLRVPRCPFFPRQLTHITTAVFVKDASRVVKNGGQIFKYLHLTSFAYGLRTERDQTYIFVWGDENVRVFNTFFGGGEREEAIRP